MTARKTAFLLILTAALALAAAASVMFGVRSISLSDALSGLGGSTATADHATAYARLPRTVMAVAVGAALALAGAGLQAVTRNPLADPGIFGVLTGAGLAVVVGMTFFHLSSPIPTMLVSICGAFAAAVFVYVVGSMGPGGPTPLKLALAGAATAAATSSAISALLLPRADVMDKFRFWQIGSVGGAEWRPLVLAAPLLAVGLLILLASAPGLNALALGDDVATGLGVNTARTRVVATVGAVVLCGAATALTGPIAFVGLVVPHVMRLVVGTDHRVLLPATALGGALLLTLADTLGRVIARPEEVAVGIITPFIGVPVFIWLIRRTKVPQL